MRSRWKGLLKCFILKCFFNQTVNQEALKKAILAFLSFLCSLSVFLSLFSGTCLINQILISSPGIKGLLFALLVFADLQLGVSVR